MVGAALFGGLCAIVLGGLSAVGRRLFAVGVVMQAAGAMAIGVVGFWVLFSGVSVGDGFGTGLGSDGLGLRFGVDGLSGLFLGALGLVAAPTVVFARRYLTPDRRGRVVAALTSLFLLMLVLVLTARDPFGFLFGWEAMTLVPAVVILVARAADEVSRRTVFTYLAITHLAGVGTWVAVLLLAHAGGLGSPGTVTSGSGLQLAIAVTALFGMGTKAGIMPLHVWLPRAHPIAPAPVSALMSGVMIKVAIYGLVRVLVDWLGVLPTWFGVLVLAVGGLSALGGVVYALFQHELKRLLALHSIENIGIILLGLGACLILRSRGADVWASIALGAALLHTVNHAVFKALLFLGAGAIERATGSLHLDRLGGVLRRMPWTGSAFAVGAMAIAGLPPLNGFASEWVTLQALLRVPAQGTVLSGVAGALALAALAATAGLAVTCFVKVVGLVLLGPARTSGEVTESPPPMVGAMLFLAGVCVLLGVAPGLLLGPLVRLAPWAPGEGTASAVAMSGASRVGLWLPGTGSLPTPGLAVVLVALIAVLSLARGRRSARPSPSWACGQVVGPELNWTSAGFTKPLRLVLEGVLRPQRKIVVDTEGGVVQEVSYRGRVPQLIDERIYRPMAQRSAAVAGHARRLQSGSLGTYVAYLIGLVVVLLGIARIGVVG
jgi:hydrogenase-4 component B